MYLEHFGLNVNPFGLSHKLDFLYKSGAFQESIAHLIYGLDNKEPVVLITGAIGAGKTMALQSFLANLGPTYRFALVTNTRVNAVELLKLILEDLGVKFPPGCDKSDLLILFKEFLVASNREGRKVLIVVDEAQNLSRDVLEEIRLLTNLGQGDGQPVQIILAGQPELEEVVNRPELAQLRQRIRVHYKLDPLTRRETQEYIEHRMRVAGCSRQAFTAAAIDRIFQLSQGIPRLVNTHCAEALLSCFVDGKATVDTRHLEEGQAPAATGSPPPAPAARPAATTRIPPPAVAAPVSALVSTPVSAPGAAPAATPAADAVPANPARTAARAEPAARRRRSRSRRRIRWWPIPAALLVALVLVFLYRAGSFEAVKTFVADRLTSARPEGTKALPLALQNPPAEPEVQLAAVVSDSVGATLAAVPAAAPTTVASNVPATGTGVAPEGRYFIHVNSFLTQDRAETDVEHWTGTGMPAFFRTAEIRGKNWFRVYLGPFPTQEAADAQARALKDNGEISYFMITRLAAGPDI